MEQTPKRVEVRKVAQPGRQSFQRLRMRMESKHVFGGCLGALLVAVLMVLLALVVFPLIVILGAIGKLLGIGSGKQGVSVHTRSARTSTDTADRDRLGDA